MENKQIALFSGALQIGVKPIPNSSFQEPKFADVLILVTETKSSRGYFSVVFDIDRKHFKIRIHNVSNNKVPDQDYLPLINTIVEPGGCSTFISGFTQNHTKSIPTTELRFIYKLDLIFSSYALQSSGLTPISMSDEDTNKVSLEQFIQKSGILVDKTNNPTVLTDTIINNVTRKFANKRKVIDWSKTWNSPLLTEEEKAALRPKLDVQVAFANKDRLVRKLIDRQFKVDYPIRKFMFNLLHGEPGSGKTTMVMKDICALNNIPVYYIIGDAKASLSKFLACVGPRNNSNNVAELTLQETAWVKCMKYNLPMVIFIDEIDTMSTLELKLLGTLITEGEITIGVNHYKNSEHTIYYFGAYNPGSTQQNEFPESFIDRALWFSVPKVSLEEKIDYRDIKYSNGFEYDEKEKLAKDNNITNVDIKECNLTALKWYIDYLKSSNQQKTPKFIEGEFVEAFADEVGPIDYAKEVTVRISKFFDKLNSVLANNTRGINKSVRNRNSTITIADRAYDAFVDYIFSFSSVAKATEAMIFNRLTGGFTLNVIGSNDVAGEDKAPEAITKATMEVLEADIKLLNNFLFKTSNTVKAEELYTEAVVKLPFVLDSTSSSSQNDENQVDTNSSDASASSFNSIGKALKNMSENFHVEINKKGGK